MAYKRKMLVTGLICCIFLALPVAYAQKDLSVAGKCMTCHKEKSPGLYKQWFASAHAVHKVTCLECHQADRKDPDAYLHYDAYISTLVTPKDCGRCHKDLTKEFESSHHAKAGLILDSLDAYLAHVTAGEPVAILGCESCHGAKVNIDPKSANKLHRKSWPNSGIGRLNPDGSKGSCNACHTRHAFSKAQARQPESCSKCHLGPDHPQKEIYEESKHGNTYYTNTDDMNLTSDQWVVGVNYYTAPTCATCHFSATTKQKLTHEAGKRIAWTLRPVASKKLENWEKRRDDMRDVCRACHSDVFTDGHFHQYDAAVRLYNDKFAAPSTEIMNLIKKKGLLKNKASFSNKVEWIYWELWHHEGRRGRHGASMMGPDYTWWHGFYEIAQHFYFKFLPEARKLNDADVNAYIDKMLHDDPLHQWLNTDTASLKKAIKSGEFQKRYASFFKD